MAIKKCRPKPFEKKTYTNQDFIDEYKKLNDEWKKFSDIKDDLWQTTMRNDKRVMQLEFQVWYYEWVNDSLKKKIKSSYLILSQLNRAIESPERKLNPDLHFPQKSDVFGADALFQYSDLVIIPHRPEMLGITQYGPYGWAVKDLIYFHYIKVRSGEPIVAKMINDLKHNRILEEAPKTSGKIVWGTGGF